MGKLQVLSFINISGPLYFLETLKLLGFLQFLQGPSLIHHPGPSISSPPVSSAPSIGAENTASHSPHCIAISSLHLLLSLCLSTVLLFSPRCIGGGEGSGEE